MPLRRIEDVRADYRRVGLWGDLTISELVDQHADDAPHRLALVDGDRSYTYGQVRSLTDRLAVALHRLNVGRGDLVAVQLPNRAEFPLTHLALNKLGAIALPVGVSWNEHEVAMLLGATAVQAAIVPSNYRDIDHASIYHRIAGLSDDRVLTVDCEAEGGASGKFWDTVGEVNEQHVDYGLLASLRPHPDDFTFINVSSGTTSTPKLSMWTDNNVIAKTLLQYQGRTRLSQRDVSLAIAPIGLASTGYQYAVLAQLLAGARSVLLRNWEPTRANEALEETRATMTTVIPTQLVKMLAVAVPSRRTYNLRCITYAGSTLAPHVAQAAEQTYGARIHAVYGATDGGVPTMGSIDDPSEKRYTTVGLPLPGEEVRIVDDLGHPLEPEETGEITWRGCNKSLGYLGDPEATDAVFGEDGWYRSGDLGMLDEEGYLHVVGRKKDMIIRGGQNINPAEVENVIIKHPAVRDVAVIGYPDPVLGERACACVVLREGASLSLEELRTMFETHRVAVWKTPERIEEFTELPRTEAAKLSKRELRDIVAARARRK